MAGNGFVYYRKCRLCGHLEEITEMPEEQVTEQPQPTPVIPKRLSNKIAVQRYPVAPAVQQDANTEIEGVPEGGWG